MTLVNTEVVDHQFVTAAVTTVITGSVVLTVVNHAAMVTGTEVFAPDGLCLLNIDVWRTVN